MTDHLTYVDVTKASDDERRLLDEIRKRDAAERLRINAERRVMLDKIESDREEQAAQQRSIDLAPTLTVVTMLRQALGDKLPAFLAATARDVSFSKVRELLYHHVAAEADRKRGMAA